MVIGRDIVDAMVAHARSEFPNEACGLLAAKDGAVIRFYPVANADASPVHYRMDPREQLHAILEIEDNEWDLAAIYHSHTHTRAYPSAEDRRLAFYPDALYIILSLAHSEEPDLRAYRIDGDTVSEEPIDVA